MSLETCGVFSQSNAIVRLFICEAMTPSQPPSCIGNYVKTWQWLIRAMSFILLWKSRLDAAIIDMSSIFTG